jgi:hypothetical protein
MKILSPRPLDRYDSMELLLEDAYFDTKNLAEHLEDYRFDTKNLAEHLGKKIEEQKVEIITAIRKQTVELRNTKKEIIEKIKCSASVTLTAIFDAIEVQTPTCFIILPEKVPPILSDKDDAEGMASKGSAAFDYIDDVIGMATDCIGSPFDVAAAFVKSKFFEKPMFLYLVDEWTGEPVTPADGVYPVEIEVRSELAKQFFPLMALGMRALALTNTAAGIINMFFPVVPSQPFPKPLLEKARRFIEESNKSGVVKRVIEKDDTASETVRGNELREFVMFLKEKDPDCTFSGLRKICDESSGKAIWVTKESAISIVDENEAANDNIEGDT